MRRVVVTGLGMVSPIGNDVASSWENCLAGKSGIGLITSFDTTEFNCKIAGEVKGFDPSKFLAPKEARRLDRFMQFGIAAGMMALEDSGLEVTEENATRIGCAIGSGIGGLPEICRNQDAFRDKGARRISPFLIPASIVNMISGQLSIIKGLKGPNIAYVTACSTGLHSIGESYWMIKRNDAGCYVGGRRRIDDLPLGRRRF